MLIRIDGWEPADMICVISMCYFHVQRRFFSISRFYPDEFLLIQVCTNINNDCQNLSLSVYYDRLKITVKISTDSNSIVLWFLHNWWLSKSLIIFYFSLVIHDHLDRFRLSSNSISSIKFQLVLIFSFHTQRWLAAAPTWALIG